MKSGFTGNYATLSKLGRVVAAALLFACTSDARAGFVPVGVQNDVSFDTVVNNWGWSVLYRGDYGASGLSVSSIFASAGQYVMLAAIRDGSPTIEVLAAALTSDVLTYTAPNTTHTANGSEWYFNSLSMGFAGIGDTINQESADINHSTFFGPNPAERDRLSWHTTGPSNGPPTTLRGGWRAGTYDFLNYSTDWDRIVLTTNDPPAAVPEPTSLVVLGSGFFGLALARRRRTAVPQTTHAEHREACEKA